MPQALPAHPSLDWLKKTAKQELARLRTDRPDAKLHQAQLDIARRYGFGSWRALKAHVDRINPVVRRAFAAAHAGDVAALRRAIASGFDVTTAGDDGRTVNQIAKELRFDAIELLVQDILSGRKLPSDEQRTIQAIATAAQSGDVAALSDLLDARPDLIDALAGTGFQKATALHLAALRNQHVALRSLIERGADLNRRDFPDNAAPLHFAVVHGDMETVRLLVEAGADIEGRGDDYALGVLGWATCFNTVRWDAADYLLEHGARLSIWTAIALDRADELREMIAADPALLAARMSRNQHRRTPLHHAAAKNRARMVSLLLELGADPRAKDATGATALTTAAQDGADAEILAMLKAAAGTAADFRTLLNMKRYDEAEAMLRTDPARIGPDGEDTIALHLAVSKRNVEMVRWLLAHGVDVNAKRALWDCNDTALHGAVERNDIEMARLLLDAGANPAIRDDKFKSTALGWAEFFGHKELAALLRERGVRS